VDASGQVVFVLKVIVGLGPMAVYFLVLGLVNSRSRPHLVSSRVDFVLLAIAFYPVMLWPVLTLIEKGHAAAAALAAAGVLAAFLWLLPARRGSWVIYHASLPQCARLIRQAARREGWQVVTPDDHRPHRRLGIPQAGLDIRLESFPWLRNVTLHFTCRHPAGVEAADRLVCGLFEEIKGEQLLPSPAGASLVVIGACLLGLPMWYLVNNMNAIVDVVARVLRA